jgi:hypothetical protein
MISLFTDAGAKLPITYNGLTLNDPDDPVDDAYEIDLATPHSNYIAIADERPTGDGTEIYEARKVSKAYLLAGRVTAPTYAELYDKIEALAAAFDPALLSFNNASTFGFLALDFSTLTNDTTNYPTGIMSCRYYARPLTSIDRLPTKFDGKSFLFSIPLMMRDPRRYLQTTSTQTGAGTITNIGDYPSPATLTITMAGAGSATYAARNNAVIGDETLTLNLSGRSNGQVVVVDMDAKTITVDGTSMPSLYVSGDYWPVEPGANVITFTNTTNATSVVSYRRAFSL